jgi:aminoglycoside phosphotransferase (APT) family kinase protein
VSPEFAAELSPLAVEVFGAAAEVMGAERGPVGNGQETWFCDIAVGDETHRVVVRRTAESGPLQWTDRAAEATALRWLHSRGLPTPPVLHFEPDGGRLGRAAIVMQLMPGEPLGRADQSTRDRLGEDLGRNLARLHAIDATDFSGSKVASAGAANRQQLEFWEGRYHGDALQPVPLLGALLAWLRHNQPLRSGRPALLWGDPGLYNILHEDGTITALLDWELTHVGDPFEDLGAAVWSCRGLCGPELVIAAYEDESGSAVDREALAWFEAFGAVTRAIMLLNGARNAVEGEPRPSMMGLSLDLLPKLLRRAAATAGWPEIVAGAERPSAAGEMAVLRPNVDETLRGIARYLDDAVLGAVDDRFIRRNLKTISALLRTSAIRNEKEALVGAVRAAATAEFLEALATDGVDVSGGLETTAIRLEAAGAVEHRDVMRRHLLEDLAMVESLLDPLRELYGLSG